jgi:glutamate formiminotransferase/formiminotetrahydrofolate cyclodeaminase
MKAEVKKMKLSEMKIDEFVKELASDSPAPGGGSVAALSASLGAALVSMVSALTAGKEKYRDNWEDMEKAGKEARELQARLLELMEEDTQAFNAFMAALKLPKDTEEQKTRRKEAIQEATRGAIDVPLKTLKACRDVALLAEIACEKGNQNAVSDAGTAAIMAQAAGKAAAYNVKINLMGLKDESFATKVREEMENLMAELEKLVDGVEKTIEKSLA